jgi:hypothetical protein
MSSSDITLWIFSRATREESVEQRHAEVMERMTGFGTPLGFAGLELPPAPEFESRVIASYRVKPSIRGLKCEGNYLYRGGHFLYEDNAKFDDSLRYGFKVTNKAIDYRAVLHEQFPKVIEAFRGYRAFCSYGSYLSAYQDGSPDGQLIIDANGYFVQNNPVYNRLREDKSIDIDGRNNIYTLRPAQYWDAELCRRALGYGPEGVMARLQGQVPRVERLMGGVYTVLNDDPVKSYKHFVAMNEQIKPVLGLI